MNSLNHTKVTKEMGICLCLFLQTPPPYSRGSWKTTITSLIQAINSTMNDDDQNRIVLVQQLLRTNISGKREESFWYEIQNFPDSLLIEILARLPVKSIYMFKSVCKHWETLISDPSFSRLYHSILNSNSNATALPFRILDSYIYVRNFKEFVNRLAPKINSSSEFSVLFLSRLNEQRRYDQLRVLDTSDGLILCCYRSPTPLVYYICDPLTRLWITIPRPGPQFHLDFCEGLITSVNEDHMLTGYTVVRVETVDSQSNYLNLNINMFSSESGKWINYELSCITPIQLCELDGGPIHCYGALQWPVRNDEYEINSMLAFDYKDPKSVRLIPLPEDRILEGEYFGVGQLCGESQGTLRYFEVAHHDPTEFYSLTMTMWAMKDYEKGEWCVEFKVRRCDMHSSNRKLRKWLLKGWFLPLSFHPSNPNVVYLSCMEPQCIVSYDVLNRRLDVACKRIDFGQDITSLDAISFVLPRWPVLVSNASVNRKIRGKKRRK